MLRNFKLAAIVGSSPQREVHRIVLHQDLQGQLAEDWSAQLDTFLGHEEAIEFDPGYTPDDNECFRVDDFEAPPWLTEQSSATVPDCELVARDMAALERIKGLAGFARLGNNQEIVLFQNFSRGNIIRPGRFMMFQAETFVGSTDPGIRLDRKLAAVYYPADRRLLFRSFKNTNTFLSLADLFAEASEEQIRAILAHERLAPENVDALAIDAPQWFRKRFALLQTQGVLNDFSPQEIQARSETCEVAVRIRGDCIVFPADRREARRLLQFLNEELFRGPISNRLYETNSKKAARNGD